jgi:hypothetical protein
VGGIFKRWSEEQVIPLDIYKIGIYLTGNWDRDCMLDPFPIVGEPVTRWISCRCGSCKSQVQKQNNVCRQSVVRSAWNISCRAAFCPQDLWDRIHETSCTDSNKTESSRENLICEEKM